ncbi:M48 family metallopeptidase [Agrilutibacter solisilvae]|uniref:M48 family metalloprotease n=1 Tax=Agrilutibacter solisilvae TaxID=2763317 RepID=A0A975ATE4_9GAMM|nr:M48 family metallopeptidase [Lysobacter solisilvae]QSX79029.1 M48 family metalloprotease [Lysobacter solisilvae]
MASRHRHAALVARLQQQIEHSPGLYRFKLAAVAAVGYAVLLLVLAFGLGLPLIALGHLLFSGEPLGYAHAYLILVPGVLGVMVWRALWIRFEKPAGQELATEQAPALFARVEQLRATTGAPPLKGIVIDGELNAAAAGVPRAWGLAGHDLYLVLGLPMLRLLDPAELDAVIAHEFGHFGQRDQAFSGWIYRVRLSWARVLEGMASRGGNVGLYLFYRWYVPWFNAYSLALARHHEYGADAVAARTTSPQAAISGLTRLAVAEHWLDRDFRPRLEARMRAQRHPTAGLQADLARALAEVPAPDPARLSALGERPAGPDDTHPSLAQRARALGGAPALRPRDGDAATHYLGAHADAIGAQLDRAWREHVRQAWQTHFDATASERARLEELERRLELDAAAHLERAQLVERLRPELDPLPLYEAARQHAPDSALLLLRTGLLLLRRGQWQTGLAQLEQAIARDAAAAGEVAAELARARLDPHLPAAAAAAIATMAASLPPVLDVDAAGDDASDAKAPDERALQPHDLSVQALDALARTLAGEPRVVRAWIACQRAALAEARSHYVLLLDYRGSVASEPAALRRLQAAMALPGPHTLFTSSDRRALASRVRQACAVPVYERPRD